MQIDLKDKAQSISLVDIYYLEGKQKNSWQIKLGVAWWAEIWKENRDIYLSRYIEFFFYLSYHIGSGKPKTLLSSIRAISLKRA